MKKKLTALALSAALTAGMLAGCGGQTSAEQTAVEVPTEPFGDTIKYDPSVEINNGEPISFDDAAGIVADAAREEARIVDVDWSGDMQPADVEKIGIDLCRLYCEQVSPEYDWAAVEASCEALVIEDVGLVLTGTTDRIYRDPILGYGIADIKTGKSAVAGRPAMPPSSACMSCWRPPATACASRPRPISSVCRRARPPKGSAPAPARWKTLVPGW